jgi:hypothetical protein
MKSSLVDQPEDARAGLTCRGSMNHLTPFSVFAAPSGLDDEIPARILRAMPRSECARKLRQEMRLKKEFMFGRNVIWHVSSAVGFSPTLYPHANR